MDKATLTILICSHDRAELLLRTLCYLDAADRPVAWEIELLIVLNACGDDSLQALENYRREQSQGLPMRWIEEPVAGKSHALNRALPEIRSQLVAFVDDDHRVEKSYLVNLCAAADTLPESDFFCGKILPDWDGSEPAWVHTTGRYRIFPLPVPRFDQGEEARRLTPEIAIPGGGNLFLRTRWLSKVGPFSTELGPTGHDLGGFEDLDWVLRAQSLGAVLTYIPTVVQYHFVDAERLTLVYLMKKAYIRTASTIVIKQQPQRRGVPTYLFRKLAEYLLFALTALSGERRRFYLVRTAAALGEIKGHLKAASAARLQ